MASPLRRLRENDLQLLLIALISIKITLFVNDKHAGIQKDEIGHKHYAAFPGSSGTVDNVLSSGKIQLAQHSIHTVVP